MTDLIQPGQHPDAELLSAFAEHALPPHEQQSLLAHLALCPDCRHVLFLARQADPASLSLPEPVPLRKPWLSGWNLAWPAAAALACAAIVTLHLHTVRTTPPHTQASASLSAEGPIAATQATPPPAPAAQRESLQAAAIPKDKAGPAPLIRTPSQRPPSPGALSGASFGIAVAPAPLAAGSASASLLAQPPSVQNKSAGGDPNSQTKPAIPYAANPVTAANPAPPPPLPVPGLARGASRHVSNSPLPQAPRTAREADLRQNAPGTVTADALDQIDATAAASEISGAVSASVAVPLASQSSAPTARAALPSRLAAKSTVARSGVTLAMDTAGTLFRSQDAGVTWQLVAPSWPGRIVSLNLTLSGASGATASLPALAAPSRPSLFQLTTESGTQWTSPDGQTWTQK